MPDSFADPDRVTKSYIPACNAPVRINVQKGHTQVATESASRNKRGRPLGSKDKNPRKPKKGAILNTGIHEYTDTASADNPDEPIKEVWDAKPPGPAGVDNNEIDLSSSKNFVIG